MITMLKSTEQERLGNKKGSSRGVCAQIFLGKRNRRDLVDGLGLGVDGNMRDQFVSNGTESIERNNWKMVWHLVVR